MAPKDTGEPREQRLARLLTRHFARVWRTLRRLGVADAAAEDAAQEVFIVTARKLDALEPAQELAFLLGTAVRVAANARRAQAARPWYADQGVLDATPDADPAADWLLHQKRLRLALDALLEALPEDLRTVFVLFELEGLHAPEIASVLGVPPGTVASRLRRARDAFRTASAELRTRFDRGLP